MTTRDEWAQALLAFGEWPVTMEKRIGLVAWAMAENTGAAWNPLATTEPASGATDWNSAGVKVYPSEQIGIEATYTTLRNGYYPDILAVLGDEGASAMSLASCESLNTWGTGNFTRVVERVKADLELMNTAVAGSGSGPAPIPTPTPTPQPGGTTTVNVPVLRSQGNGPYTQPVQPVRVVQVLVGASVDGKFGAGTEAAVRNAQAAHGITADGIVGPVTWDKLVNG